MIYFIAAVNCWAALVLWKYFKLLKKEYYESMAKLEESRRREFAAKCESEAWKQQANNLQGIINSLKAIGFHGANQRRNS